ncbi:hypothetical protein KW796_02020 [Candidatus Parcubacteria bacterium]|nr:hypothetical protein [Candidatus Parcubacteria bacterium]
MKRLITAGILSSLFLFAGVAQAATVISATGSNGNFVTTLENKVSAGVDANQPLADVGGTAISDSSYFTTKGYSYIEFALSGDSLDTTPVRILPPVPAFDQSKFQMWAFSPVDSKWYDVNALGFGDPEGIPLNLALGISPVKLYVLGTESGTFPTTVKLVNTAGSADPSDDVLVSETSVDLSVTAPVTNSEGESYLTLSAAVAGTNDGGTVELHKNLTTSAQVTVSKPLTINGNDFTLASPFAKTDNSNNSAIGIINTNNVTINNLIVNGTDSPTGSTGLHGINVFQSSGVNLNTVTTSNYGHAGVVVNASTVTVNNVTTANNIWGGINVDKGTVSFPAMLTVNGVSHHTESTAIWKDDNSNANVSVVDTNNQYTSATYTHDAGIIGTIYTLKAIVSQADPVVEIVNPTAPVTVTIDSGTVNPELDVSSLVDDITGIGTLPQITIESNTMNVVISAATVVNGGAGWDGVIDAPTIVSAPTIVADSGNTATAVLAIEVGAGDTPLTFSKAVRLALAGQAGNLVGWSQAGAFHQINATCSADDQTTMDTELADGADCKTVNGADLVVWTKHFTTFVTYTQTAIPTAPSSGGGGGTSAARKAINLASLQGSANVGAGQVLGAFTGPEETSFQVDSAQIVAVKTQLVALIKQLISLLQAQLAAAVTSGTY